MPVSEPMSVMGVTITSLPAGRARAPSVMCTEAVPLEQAMQCFLPYSCANARWNSKTLVPMK